MSISRRPSPDALVTFRLGLGLLNELDGFCVREDITRSHAIRRSIVTFLKTSSPIRTGHKGEVL
jgi:hypothetical protein